MLYTTRKLNPRDDEDQLRESLEPVVRGMEMSLVELHLFRQKGRGQGNVQIKMTVLKKGTTGVDDCSKVHRAVLPRLELAFPDRDIYLEVSSPGIDRLIKDGSEFVHYAGMGIKCYCTDVSDWVAGILLSSDEKQVVLRAGNGEKVLPYGIIAKARLDN